MKAWSCPGPYPKIVLEKTARKVLDHLRVHGSSVRSSWPQTPYAGFIWLKSALPILARLTSIYDQIQALFEAGAFARLVQLLLEAARFIRTVTCGNHDQIKYENSFLY
ncbi:hypothetical protein V6N13_014432 [Hibiscus sabdariffa]